MEHTALMGVMHRARHGGEKSRGFTRIVAACVRRLALKSNIGFWILDLSERLAQVRPFDQAHAEIVLPLMLADFVNGHDVRMRKARRRFRFSLETLDQIGCGQRPCADELERYQSIEAELSRFEHDAHTAAGDLFEQFIIAEIT